MLWFFVGEMDLALVNESAVITPPSLPRICVTVVATNDQIAEGTESFYFTVRASNPLDRISGNTTIDITDNDGKMNKVPKIYLEQSLPDLIRCGSLSA
jgi:hypothetical protein